MLQEGRLQHWFSIGSENLLGRENSRSFKSSRSVNLALALALSSEFSVLQCKNSRAHTHTYTQRHLLRLSQTHPGRSQLLLQILLLLDYGALTRAFFPPALTLLTKINITVLTAQGTR